MARTPPPQLSPDTLLGSDPDAAVLAPTTSELLPLGFTLGNYVVKDFVGRGAMASVYRAEHALLKKQLALKVMDASLLGNAEARQRFLQEAQAAAAIKHPNVVDITDFGVASGLPYLVMELLDGEDLERYLEHEQRLTEHELVALALPLVSALAAAHDGGVLHRDLKPGNVFLARSPDGEMVPKLLDFGVSKFTKFQVGANLAATPSNRLLGSPLYLPPEAARGDRELTASSDQYSLAVVLYEAITGRPPFPQTALLPLLNAIAEGRFEAPRRVRPEISAGLERVLLRALHRDPNQRFPHIRELGRALLACGDLRTLALWGPSFGRSLPAELVPGGTPLALAAPIDAPPPPAFVEKAASPRRPLWALALGLVGVFALWITIGRDLAPRAPTPQSGAAALTAELRAPEPQVVALPLNVPSAAAAAPPHATVASAPDDSAPAAHVADVAAPPRLRPRSNRARAELPPPSRRAEAAHEVRQPLPDESAEPDDDRLKEMFFSTPRPRATQQQVFEAPVANEAPILD